MTYDYFGIKKIRNGHLFRKQDWLIRHMVWYTARLFYFVLFSRARSATV